MTMERFRLRRPSHNVAPSEGTQQQRDRQKPKKSAGLARRLGRLQLTGVSPVLMNDNPNPRPTTQAVEELNLAKQSLKSGPGEAELFVVGAMMPDPRLPSTLQDVQTDLYRTAADRFGLGQLSARRR